MSNQRNYPYQAKGQHSRFKASQRLLMRWHISQPSLKSSPI